MRDKRISFLILFFSQFIMTVSPTSLSLSLALALAFALALALALPNLWTETSPDARNPKLLTDNFLNATMSRKRAR